MWYPGAIVGQFDSLFFIMILQIVKIVIIGSWMRFSASAASRVRLVYPPQISSCANFKRIFSISTHFLYPMAESVTNVVYETLLHSNLIPLPDGGKCDQGCVRDFITF